MKELNLEISRKYELLKTMMNNTTDAIYVKDTEGRYLLFNLAAEKYVGKTAAEVLGKDDYNLFQKDEATIVIKGDRKVMRDKRTETYEEQVTNASGEISIFLSTKGPIFDSENKVIGLFGIARDITARKKTEEMLKLNKNSLDNIINSINAGTWELNVQTGEETINERWAEIIGYTISELYPVSVATWEKHTHPGDFEKVQKHLQEVFEKKIDNYDIEFRMKHKDGRWVWVNGIGKVNSWTVDGMPLMTSGIHIDITYRKEIAELIRESEHKHRLLTENISDVIWVFNLTKFKFTYFSPSIYKLRGITVEEALNETMEDSLAPSSLKRIQESIKRDLDEFIANPKLSDFSVHIAEQPCKNGGTVWVETFVKYTYNDYGEIEVTGASRDISARKKAEEKIVYLSYHDQLTDLYNRRFYEEELKRLDSMRNLPLTLAMGDVNGLKLVNDYLGHMKGDELLKKISNVLRKACRTDDIIARLGGDEFIIILPKTDAADAEKVIERIKEYSKSEKIGLFDVSISFGHQTKVKMSDNIEDIFKSAEDLMYKQKSKEISRRINKTIKQITNTLYENSHREMMHSERVSTICEDIAIAMELPKNDIKQVKIAGLMHDIGKIEIDKEILNGEKKLNNAEWKKFKRHPEVGHRILNSLTGFSEIAIFVLEHHERWDGTGYPKGLKDEKISLAARIIAIAEAYDVLTNEETYTTRLPKVDAIIEIEKQAGKQFDPNIVKIFIEEVARNF